MLPNLKKKKKKNPIGIEIKPVKKGSTNALTRSIACVLKLSFPFKEKHVDLPKIFQTKLVKHSPTTRMASRVDVWVFSSFKSAFFANCLRK